MIALLLAAALTDLPPPAAVHELLASKLQAGVLVDLTRMHRDPTSKSVVCGQVQLNRSFDTIKFVADVGSGVVWLEKLPIPINGASLLRPNQKGLVAGERPALENAWRACDSHGEKLAPP